jgi:hypothetical protein
LADFEDEGVSVTDLAGLLIGGKEGDTAGQASGKPAEPTPTEAQATEEPDNLPEDRPEDEPDEGTDSDEPAEPVEEDDAPDGAADEEPSTEPFYTVKIDGKDERVTLKEALAGYQRQVDYTRKTEQAAVDRRAAEAEATQARTARDQYAQGLQLILDRLGSADQELTAEQWNDLRQTDPGKYVTQWTDYQRREEQRNIVRGEQARIHREKQAEQINTARSFVEQERAKLVKHLPIFADQEKGPAEMKALREYAAKTFKFSDAEIDQAYDHRMVLMLDKARRWDNHQAALSKAKGKIENAVQVPAPGARQPPGTARAKALKVAQEKFNRSGDIEDAIPLLFVQQRR